MKKKHCVVGALFVFLKTNSFAFARFDFFILWTRKCFFLFFHVDQCGRVGVLARARLLCSQMCKYSMCSR